jgi:hypothetical protein
MSTYTIKQKGYFYDSQIKRYLVQLMSCFAGYRVRSGKQRDGEHRMISVPVIYGDNSRVASYILSGGNENSIISLPIIAVDMTRLKQAEQYRRAPQHTERMYWTERASQNIEGTPGTGVGTHWSAERYMPVPYDFGIRLNMWSSNTDQAFQLLEQIMTQFNPEMDIQLSNSPMDWSFMTTLKFDGEVAFGRTSAGIGEGAKDDPYHVNTLDFSTIIHMSPPTKVYEAKIIETIHANIKQLNDERDFDTMTDLETFIITSDGIE